MLDRPLPDLTVPNFQTINVLRPEGPAGRVVEEDVLHQEIAGVRYLEQVGPVLPPHQVANTRQSPPDLTLPVQGAQPGRGEGHVVDVEEMEAVKDVARGISRPLGHVIGHQQGSI